MSAGVAQQDGRYWLFGANGVRLDEVRPTRDGAGFVYVGNGELVEPEADAPPVYEEIEAIAVRYVSGEIDGAEMVRRLDRVGLQRG